MKNIVTSLLFLVGALGMAQSSNTNYVKTTTYKVASTDGTVINPDDKIETIQYFDGLGRPIQSIQVKAGGNKENIIQHMEYDEYGRQVKNYLPYASNGQITVDPLNMVVDPVSGINTYYQTNYGDDFTSLILNPYSETEFENSPLSRPLKQSAPGADWAMGNGHEVKMGYQTNVETDGVKMFGVNFNSTVDLYEPTLVYEGSYSNAQLYKSIVKDENWTLSNGRDHTVEAFKDKQGRVILKRTYENNQEHDTYYVYDDFGNLTYVIPPSGTDQVIEFVNISTLGQTINFPWTDVVNVDREFAQNYNEALSEYDNLQILNVRIENAYNGQGGMTVTTYSNSDKITVNFNLSVQEPIELLQGYVLDLQDYGSFDDTDIGILETNDYNYAISIKSNHIFISGGGELTQLNTTITNQNGVSYDINYPWTDYMDVSSQLRTNYEEELDNYDNSQILNVIIPNAENGRGGLKVTVDDNDNVQVIIDSSHDNPLSIISGAYIPLNINRSLINRDLGSISGTGFNYTVELYNNGLKFGGSGDIGHLTATLSGPNVIQEPSIDQATVDGLCYIYEYDHRNRLVEKKIPGKDWEHIVYDLLDRPVLTQDGNQRVGTSGTAANWMFTKYDKLGRVIYTGLFKSPLSRKQIQQQLDAQSASDLFELRTTGGFTNGNKTIRYTNSNYPTDLTKMTVLSISYYDDGTRSTGANREYDTNVTVSNSLDYSDEYSPVLSTSNIGLPTISEIRVLGTNDWITSASYYDEKGRAIFGAVENTHLGTWDKNWSQMDFIGKVSETKTQHFKQSLAQTITTYDYLTYDHMDRLLIQDHKIGAQAVERIVSNSYDAMGQLESKGVGGKSTATQSLQNLDYDYNVRGWLTSINDVENLGNDLFGFDIRYNAPTLGNGSEALYNGNISEILWKTANDGIKRGYQYGYDALNRIKYATYRGGSLHQGSGMLENYSINSVNYDKNGNIITLNRFGLFENAQNNQSMDYVDKLTYEYSPKSNQLIDVTDNADDASSNTFNGGFKDKYSGTNYIYGDANGNMTKDNNKDIQSISYNHLNLPTQIQFNSGRGDDRTIVYTYDATGTKLKKEIFLTIRDLFNPVADKTTYYAGNYIYEKDGSGESLEFFSHPEGYIEKNGSNYDYVYQYKDHLNNVRLSYSDDNNDGSIDANTEIREENNYYPFGLKMKGFNNVITGRDHKYGFGGKEEQNELGLEWMDFHARNYDAALGRWMNLDPHSEKYYNLSPYNYVANNPTFFIDPDGKDIVIGLDDSVKAFYRDGKLYTDDTYETEFTDSNYVRKNGKLRNGFLKDVVVALDTLREENISLAEGEGNFVESLQEGSYLSGGHTTFISEGKRSTHQRVNSKNGGTISKIKLNRGESYSLVPTEYEFEKSNISNAVAHELGHSYSHKNGTYDDSIIGYDSQKNPIGADEYIGSYVENRYRKASGQGLRTHYGINYNQYDQPSGMNVSLIGTQNVGGNTVRRAIKSNTKGSITYFNFNF